MQLNRFDYYSDYVAYPVLIAALGGAAIVTGDRQEFMGWCVAVVAGFTFWTFAEYWIHRVVLHWMPYFSPMHGEHHAAPLAFIGTPTWISMLTLGTVVLTPAWLLLGFQVGSGVFIGVCAGYLWYGTVHHAIHHNATAFGQDVLRGSRARHLKHHFRPQEGNFGVTTGLWDHVFGTALPAGRAAAQH